MLQGETGAEIVERVEMRDAWLGVLLPVAVATLLLLALIILRQRRRGSTSLNGLFHPIRVPMGPGGAATDVQRSAEARRLEQKQAEQLRQAEIDATAAVRHAAVAAETKARLARKIPSLDGETAILEVGRRIRVRTDRAAREEKLFDITDAGLGFADNMVDDPLIPWEEVQEIHVRHGRGRRWGIPVVLGGLGASLLGAAGWLLDEAGRSTMTGEFRGGRYLPWALLTGVAAAGGFGLLIMYALPGPRWQKVVEVREGSPPLTPATFAARAADTQNGVSAGGEGSAVEVIARILLVLVVFATCAVFGR